MCRGALIALPFSLLWSFTVTGLWTGLTGQRVHCSACLHVGLELGVCVHRHGEHIDRSLDRTDWINMACFMCVVYN